VPVALSMQVN